MNSTSKAWRKGILVHESDGILGQAVADIDTGIDIHLDRVQEQARLERLKDRPLRGIAITIGHFTPPRPRETIGQVRQTG